MNEISTIFIYQAISSVRRNGCGIKANIETFTNRPNIKSRNVEMRNELDLYVNVLHCHSRYNMFGVPYPVFAQAPLVGSLDMDYWCSAFGTKGALVNTGYGTPNMFQIIIYKLQKRENKSNILDLLSRNIFCQIFPCQNQQVNRMENIQVYKIFLVFVRFFLANFSMQKTENNCKIFFLFCQIFPCQNGQVEERKQL